MLGHLRADGEAPLQLLLDAGDHLLVFLRGEALHSCRRFMEKLLTLYALRSQYLKQIHTGEASGHSGIQRGNLEEPEGLVHLLLSSHSLQLHFGQRLCDANDGLQLPEQTAREGY